MGTRSTPLFSCPLFTGSTRFSILGLLAGVLLLAPACGKKEAGDRGPVQAKATTSVGGGEATGVGTAAPEACKSAEAKGPLAWFADDYPAALACAKQTKRPLVIDLWAKWCHTCLSMKHTVLMDNSLEPYADRFVWLELDTDQEKNAPALAKFPPQVWPTFYVVAPGDESVQARYLGAASIGQFRALVTEGEKAVLALEGGDLPEGSPLRLVRDGDRAMAQSEVDGGADVVRPGPRRASQGLGAPARCLGVDDLGVLQGR